MLFKIAALTRDGLKNIFISFYIMYLNENPKKVNIICRDIPCVLPVHTTRVNNSYQCSLLDLTKPSRNRIDWLLMPPKEESKKKPQTLHCLIKTLQTLHCCYVNSSVK